MSEVEMKYASERVREFEKEKLIEKREGLERELAAVSFHLMKLEEELDEFKNNSPATITARIRTAHNEFHDDGYMGGYAERNKKTFRITASYFVTAFLGALASQESMIGSGQLSGTNYEHDRKNMFADYSSITLEGISVGEEDLARPLDEVNSAFRDSREEAFSVVESLREKIKTNNPYENIPIKINKTELLDAMLRIEILKYCQENDPHFSIEKIEKGDR